MVVEETKGKLTPDCDLITLPTGKVLFINCTMEFKERVAEWRKHLVFEPDWIITQHANATGHYITVEPDFEEYRRKVMSAYSQLPNLETLCQSTKS